MGALRPAGCAGDAELELVDSLDPFSEGIVFRRGGPQPDPLQPASPSAPPPQPSRRRPRPRAAARPPLSAALNPKPQNAPPRSVRPPKKSWKNIANLSGGEKTLSSLALVFALHHYKPTPLYVMDEIDAALDFKNVSIVAHYIKERTKNAQFVIISLRNNMFELADRLVGIYKTDNTTKSVTINPGFFAVGDEQPAAVEVA